MRKTSPTFWVTNISNRNVSLSDLALTIPAYSTVNLMDTRHYYYTLEQLEKSHQSGSLFKKRDKLVKRRVAPIIKETKTDIDREATIPSRERSVLEIKEEEYEELQITNEEFASENADLIDLDNRPVFTKKE